MTQFGVDPVADAVDAALRAVERGENPSERRLFDFKGEAGRRGADGTLRPGDPHNDPAARKLAGEVACMANSVGGGALIVGIAADGTPIGAVLDADWLQVRLFQLLQQSYTTVVTPAQVCGARVLIIRCPPAVEPIRWQNRITWRVGDQCQDIDPATWHERRARSWGYDWSAQSSGLAPSQVRPQAVLIARGFLQSSGDPRAEDLADAGDEDLLRRLAVIKDDGMLTNAGALLFAARRAAAVDHIRRPGAGADSEERINEPGRSVLEELADVFAAVRAYNPEVHVEQGLVIGRVRALPERAVREAIVNGIAHREWTDEKPTTVEHIGRTLRVTSPGGFYGGVRSDNIINHPPVSRNKDLSQLLATLRIAERQGVGVDRMFADMIRHGHPSPVIEEVDGVSVRTVLAGERPDLGWIRWIAEIVPDPRRDLRVLMALHHLAAQQWTDPMDLAPVLQLTREESRQTVQRLLDHRAGGSPICHEIDGVPDSAPIPSVAMGAAASTDLVGLRRDAGLRSRPLSREQIARSYASARGRISTTELGSIVGAARTNVGAVLRGLEEQGALEPSRENRRGPGFFYRYVADDA